MNITRPTEFVAPKVWSEDDSARLTTLWTNGTYMSELARRFRCSKQAIKRQVVVLGLAGRPSPIRAGGSKPNPAKPLPRGASTLPALASLNE